MCGERRIDDVRERAYGGESSLGGDVWQSIKLNKHKVRMVSQNQDAYLGHYCFEVVSCGAQASLFLPPKDEEEGGTASSQDGEKAADASEGQKVNDDAQADKGKAESQAAVAASNSLAGLLGGYGSPGSDDSDSDDSDD